MEFPFDFGFIPSTKADDGDPIDVLVLMDGPGIAGAVVEVRLLGVIEAEERDGGKPVRNDRLVAVAANTTERGHLRSLRDLDPGLSQQIDSFFETYTRLAGKEFHVLRRRGPSRAVELVKKARVTQK
jgi:inorganic pyrophosphatase